LGLSTLQCDVFANVTIGEKVIMPSDATEMPRPGQSKIHLKFHEIFLCRRHRIVLSLVLSLGMFYLIVLDRLLELIDIYSILLNRIMPDEKRLGE